MLNLSDVSSVFHDSIWIVYTVWQIFVSMLTQILLENAFKMSNKPNKIWHERLNPRIFKYEWLNWYKVSKRG